MRTSFTLDPDLVPKLKALVRSKKMPMRIILNDLVRAGIRADVDHNRHQFEVRSVNLKLKSGYDLTKLNSAFDELENEGAFPMTGAEILGYFSELASRNELPSFESLDHLGENRMKSKISRKNTRS